MDDEQQQDEAPTGQTIKCKATLYFHALDSITGEIISRYNGLEEVCSMFGFLHPQRYSELGCEMSSFQQILFNRIEANDSEGQSQGVMPYLTFIVTTDQCDVYPQLEILLGLLLCPLELQAMSANSGLDAV